MKEKSLHQILIDLYVYGTYEYPIRQRLATEFIGNQKKKHEQIFKRLRKVTGYERY